MYTVLEHLPNAEYVTLKKYFSHQNLVLYYSGTPPIKVKLV
jgi:hypothetical protein